MKLILVLLGRALVLSLESYRAEAEEVAERRSADPEGDEPCRPAKVVSLGFSGPIAEPMDDGEWES